MNGINLKRHPSVVIKWYAISKQNVFPLFDCLSPCYTGLVLGSRTNQTRRATLFSESYDVIRSRTWFACCGTGYYLNQRKGRMNEYTIDIIHEQMRNHVWFLFAVIGRGGAGGEEETNPIKNLANSASPHTYQRRQNIKRKKTKTPCYAVLKYM